MFSPSTSRKAHLFHRLCLSTPNQDFTGFRTRKAASLLSFLALYPNTEHLRADLLDRFWADLSPESGRNGLSLALSHLRSLLHVPALPDCLLTTRNSICLSTLHFTTDVIQFEKALECADPRKSPLSAQQRLFLEKALAFYTGDLLTDQTEVWVLGERERLRRLAITAWRSLASLDAETEDFALALRSLRRALELDSLEAETVRLLMGLLLQNGDSVGAVREFKAWEARLRDELGAAPDAQTQALIAPLLTQASPAVLVSEAAPFRPPQKPDSFFGRQEERKTLTRFLKEGAQRITITGPGGVGKTRFVTEAAKQEVGLRRVYFVSLVEINDAAQLPFVLGEAVGYRGDLRSDPARILGFQLNKVSPLLILDNCEQVAEAAAQWIAALQNYAPHLTVLATSRIPLGLAGEHLLPLEPLRAFGSGAQPLDPFQEPALALFESRAASLKPDFRLTMHNIEEVRRLLKALGGLPLSIELASSRILLLTPGEMLRFWEENPLRLLSSRRGDRPLRHRSLETVIEWSVRLLPSEVRRFWVCLGVFESEWTLEAAREILQEPQTLDFLAQLQEASLLRSEAAEGGETRFSFLVEIQAYLQLRFQKEAESEALRKRYALYYAGLAGRLAEKHRDREAELASVLLQEERNYRRALLLLADFSQWASLAEMVISLYSLWAFWNFAEEGIRWLERVARLPWLPEVLRGAALSRLCGIKSLLGQSEGMTELRELALTTLRRGGNEPELLRFLAHSFGQLSLLEEAVVRGRAALSPLLVTALQNLAIYRWHRGEFEQAERLFEEGIERARPLEDRTHLMDLLGEEAYFRLWKGEHNAADACLQELGQIGEKIAAPSRSHLFWMQGTLALNRGDYGRARELLEGCVKERRPSGASQGLGSALITLGTLELWTEHTDRARACFTESRQIWHDLGNFAYRTNAEGHLARTALACGSLHEAERLFRACLEAASGSTAFEKFYQSLFLQGLGMTLIAQGRCREAKPFLRESLRTRSFWKISRGCLEGLFGIALTCAEDNPLRSASLLGAAQGWAERRGFAIHPLEEPAFETLAETLRRVLGEKEFLKATGAGASFSEPDAVRRALLETEP